LLVLLAAGWMHDHAPAAWWPHAWPFAFQTLAMVLAVDLFRYWLHRACHTFTPLWRLHEVHHSPDILYTLNVGRFHPLEKVLHFTADTVPFVLLGVAPEVIAGYFLLYAVNGLFQHSNLRLRYGFLNYIVGSAETHRWHHARDPKTAQCNFSNTTILWDLLFGSFYLPKQRTLDIGISDRSYPKDFWSQMWMPFRRSGGRRRTLQEGLANLATAAALRAARLSAALRIRPALRDPMRAQRRVLREILARNRETSFGRAHGFAAIRSHAHYAAQVPVGDFEAHRPYVEAEIERGERALTREPPVRYLRTSGTTGQPKDVPLTASHLARLRRIHRWAVAQQHRHYPEAFAGSILALSSPAREGVLANGKPYGSASGIVAGSTPRILRGKFVVPAAVLSIEDSRLKYLTILRLALARSDITYAGSANASTLLMLMRLCREHLPALCADLVHGGFFLADQWPPGLAELLRDRLRAQPGRARELTALSAAHGDRLRIADLWPDLQLVVTWTGGSAGIALAALRRELPPATCIHELGYLASEFRGTLTLGRRAGSGLPTFDTHFFEFVARDRWDRGEPEFLTLDRLHRGALYYVIVTTPSGLYRYFINDLVKVTGFLHRMPLLQFVQKGKGVTNITGEKLYEAQVLAAVQRVLADMGRAARFVMMLADEQASRYRLFVETDPGPRASAQDLGAAVDRELSLSNIEYRAKRESSRLHAPLAAWLQPGTEQRYRRFAIAQGQREGQLKTVALAYRSQFAFDLDAHRESDRRER
jgi:sterol desaturase/sphingolipid hydroxylase (fatty acid hydroxylase superfamily)